MDGEKDYKSLNQDYTLPDPNAYTAFQRGIYSALRNPPFSVKPAEWEALAKAKTPKANYGYIFGSAGTGKTHAANLAAFDKYRLRPRMLVNATRRDLSVELFGKRYPHPILAGPVGVQQISHPEGEEATARAFKEMKVPLVLSTAASRTIEEVAAANGDGDRWFQLYWPRPQYEEVTASLLQRAKREGYKVLVVTLDTMLLAWRPYDLDEAFLPFVWGTGTQIGFSDPVFTKRYEETLAQDTRTAGEKFKETWDFMTRPGSITGAGKVLANAASIKKANAWLDCLNSGTYREWEHLKILKKLWDGPIVLKGIQTAEDARLAIDYGMDGIIVSNHGGRQLDGAVASLDALAEITADEKVKASGLTVLFDGGIRTGSDVLKAIALGAKAVLIARPYMYGLAFGGQKGVEHVLRCMLADTDNMLGNLGKTSLSDVGRHDLQIGAGPKL